MLENSWAMHSIRVSLQVSRHMPVMAIDNSVIWALKQLNQGIKKGPLLRVGPVRTTFYIFSYI